MVYHVPRFFQVTVVPVDDSTANGSDLASATAAAPYILRETDFATTPSFRYGYGVVAYLTLMYALPLGLIATFSALLLRGLRRSAAAAEALVMSVGNGAGREQRARRRAAEDRVTRTVVAIVLLFLACEAPDVALQGMWIAGDRTYNVFVYGSNCALVVQASVNWVVYALAGDRFRSTLRRLCCYCCCSSYRRKPRQQQQQQQQPYRLPRNGGDGGARIEWRRLSVSSLLAATASSALQSPMPQRPAAVAISEESNGGPTEPSCEARNVGKERQESSSARGAGRLLLATVAAAAAAAGPFDRRPSDAIELVQRQQQPAAETAECELTREAASSNCELR